MKPAKTKRRDRAAKARKLDITETKVKKGFEGVGSTGYRGVINRRPVFVSKVKEDVVDVVMWPFGNVLHMYTKDPQAVKSVVSKVSKAGVLVPEFVGYSKEENVAYFAFGKIGSKKLDPEQINRLTRKRNTLGGYLRGLNAKAKNPGYMKQLRKILSKIIL